MNIKDLSFWLMQDNHLFIEIKPNSFSELSIIAKELALDNPYGTLGARLGEKQMGELCNIDKVGKAEIHAWIDSIQLAILEEKMNKE